MTGQLTVEGTMLDRQKEWEEARRRKLEEARQLKEESALAVRMDRCQRTDTGNRLTVSGISAGGAREARAADDQEQLGTG
jgi:hypothetical protein